MKYPLIEIRILLEFTSIRGITNLSDQILPNPYNINTINAFRNKLGFSSNPLQVFFLEYNTIDNNRKLNNKRSKHVKLLKVMKTVSSFLIQKTTTFIVTIEPTGLLLLELEPDVSSFSNQHKFIPKDKITNVSVKHINDNLNTFTITYLNLKLTYRVPVHVGLLDQPKNEQDLQQLLKFKPTHHKPTKVGYMFCHHCGKKISADALFCHYCGAKQQPEVITNPYNRLCYDLRTTSPKYSDADDDKAIINYAEKMGFEPIGDYFTTCKYSYNSFIYDFNTRGLIIFMVEYHQGDKYTSSYYEFTGDNAFVPNRKIHSVSFKQNLLNLCVYVNDNPMPIKFSIPKFMKKTAYKLEQRFTNIANK